ncbi:MAG: zinc-binding dehydrogenase [Gemmatimonadetes bacterium]|nr:zinc-binding dehydrogenase [Gemmatimonadota bacterium]
MPKQMRAAVFSEFGPPGVVHIEEVPASEPGPGEVRGKVGASSLNHLDVWVRRGLPVGTTMPHIGGSDVAGTVDVLGPGGTGFVPGTRVAVDPSLHYEWYAGQDQGPGFESRQFQILGEHTQGGFAEYAVVPAANLLALPDHVPFESAAAAGLVFVTAWRGLMTRARLRAGERVLITGASGGVSTAAIQIAKLAGATVYAVTSGPENVERVRALGADHVYDRKRTEDFSREIWRDTEKKGVHVALDSVGEAVWPQCLKALGIGGRLVSYGATTGARGSTEIRVVFWKQLSILGTTMGSPREYREVMRLMFDGKLKPVIHEVIPLAQAARAHEMLEAGAVFGKLVLVP